MLGRARAAPDRPAAENDVIWASDIVEDENNARIRTLLEELESACPKEGGNAGLDFDYDDAQLVCDKTALLRLGVGIAAGTFRPLCSQHGYEDAVDHRADDVFDVERPFVVTVRRVDTWPRSLKDSGRLTGWKDSVLAVGCALAVVVAAFLMILGVVQIVSWV
jgi:hypothetical protein